MKKRTPKRFLGFTLVELLIAVSVFSIAISISSGGFVRALRTQRQLIALISANSSVSLAIEQMARAIRTGYDFTCNDAGSACDELTFTTAGGNQIAYFIEGDTLMSMINNGAPQPLTPAVAQIRDLGFILLEDPNYPPRITIVMGVTAKTQGLEGSITSLQTTVSSRNF